MFYFLVYFTCEYLSLSFRGWIRIEGLNNYMVRVSLVFSYLLWSIDLSGKLPLECQRIREMEHLIDINKEIEILRDEREVQKKLAKYWEGRWEHEYSEKIELLQWHKVLLLRRFRRKLKG